MLDRLEWNQDSEKLKRESDLNKLKETEGWKNLTDRQRLVVVELLGERNLDQAWLDKTYCFSAVVALEVRNKFEWSNDILPYNFFEIEQYVNDCDVETLDVEIKNFGYPCVLFCWDADNKLGPGWVSHALVVMGKSVEGETLVFEKENKEEPYRVTELNEAIRQYVNVGRKWGIRKLRKGDIYLRYEDNFGG